MTRYKRKYFPYGIQTVLYLICFIISTFSCLPVNGKNVTSSTKNILTIAYGTGKTIRYDLKNGTYLVNDGNRQLFSNVGASFTVNGYTDSSTTTNLRSVIKTAVQDEFGQGTKYTISWKAKKDLTIQQVFYTYAGHEFFLTQLIISGHQLKSNRLIPFSGDFKPEGQELRSVFTPFDNDAFVSYEDRLFKPSFSGWSAETGIVFDGRNRQGFIVGSIDHGTWKTGVQTKSSVANNQFVVHVGYTDAEVTRDKIPHGYVSGNRISSPRIFVGYFIDWRTGMESYGQVNRLADKPLVFTWTAETPVGWNSWGVLKEKINPENITKVADFFADSLVAFRTGNTAYIDLDSYWDNLLNGGIEGDYSKLKVFADHCKSKGLLPGIYWAPFTDWGWSDGPQRKVPGSNYTFGALWTKTGTTFHDFDGARGMDPTHPGTLRRIDLVIGKLKACGFKMIKIDFLGHAAAESSSFYNPEVKTGMQAFRFGMEYLTRKLDGQMLIYAAISPNLATARYVHTRRIACDAFKDINDTRYTLNSMSYGWWQSRLYDFIDADHVVLENEKEGANRARILSAAITGTFITGDDFSTSGPHCETAIRYYQDPELLRIIKSKGGFRPVEAANEKGASTQFIKKINDEYYLAVFNYDDESKVYTLDPERLVGRAHISAFTELLKSPGIDPKHLEVKLEGKNAALYKFSILNSGLHNETKTK